MAKLVSETYGEALFSLGMEKEIVDSLMGTRCRGSRTQSRR